MRAEDPCRLARLSTKGEAERVPCSSHVPGSDPPENPARKQPPRRRIGDGRGGWPFARHPQASEQPLDDGGHGCATRQRRSVRWSRQAARTPPRTRRPTPARPRAARSTRRCLSALNDPPFEYIAASRSDCSSAIEWSTPAQNQISPTQPQSAPDHRNRGARARGASLCGPEPLNAAGCGRHNTPGRLGSGAPAPFDRIRSASGDRRERAQEVSGSAECRQADWAA
jgi:hypothetical protein